MSSHSRPEQGDAEAAILFDFVDDFLDDLDRGGPAELGAYLARYPGHEALIAREYLRLVDESAGSVEGDEAAQGETDERRVGPYRLLRPLGAGGQGQVFLAQDTRIARTVALKLLHSAFVSEEARRRFRREAEVIANLEHPGICGILEAEVDGELPYIAMRYVEGHSLSAVIERARELAAREELERARTGRERKGSRRSRGGRGAASEAATLAAGSNAKAGAAADQARAGPDTRERAERTTKVAPGSDAEASSAASPVDSSCAADRPSSANASETAHGSDGANAASSSENPASLIAPEDAQDAQDAKGETGAESAGATGAESAAEIAARSEAGMGARSPGPDPDAVLTELARQCCRPGSSVALAQALRTFERAARALHAAHETGVVHRDIKPGNLAITPAGDPVVLDFGLARDQGAPGDDLTRSGEVFGTPIYMSPEQLSAASDRLDRRTDVYSLGVTLYEALTLRRPFESDSRIELERAILEAPVPDPRPATPWIGEELKVVLETALEKDPARRYPTALEFAEDLRRIREFEPIRARPASVSLQLRRWVRRNPALATALIATLVLLAGGLAISLTLLSSERAAVKAKDIALHERGEALEEKELALEAADLALVERGEALAAADRALTEKAAEVERANGLLVAHRTARLLAKDPAAALALALRAVELAPNFQTLSALYAPLFACRLEHVLENYPAMRVWDMAIASDGEQVFAALDQGGVQAWSIVAGTRTATFRPSGVNALRVAAHPAGRLLAVASFDEAAEGSPARSWVEIFDRHAPEDAPLARLAFGESPVVWLEFSRDGANLVAQSAEAGARVLRSGSWAVACELSTAPLEASSARFDPSGRLVLTASRYPVGRPAIASTRAVLWETATGRPRATLDGHEAPIQCAEFTPTGTIVATGDAAGRLILWSSAGERLEERELEGAITALAFSPRGDRLAVALRRFESRLPSGSREAVSSTGARLFALAPSGRLSLERVLECPSAEGVHGLAFSPDGRRLATTSRDDVRVHELDGAREPLVFEAQILPVSSRWTPDGRRLVTLSQSEKLHVWRTWNQPFAYELRGHEGPIRFARFWQDGRSAVTGGDDGRLCVWNTPVGVEQDAQLDPGRLIGELGRHASAVVAGALDEERAWLVSADVDGEVCSWDLERRLYLGSLGDVGARPLDVALAPAAERVLVLDERGRLHVLPSSVADGARVFDTWRGAANESAGPQSADSPAPSAQRVAGPNEPLARDVLGFGLDPAGSRVACVGLGTRLALHDLATGRLLAAVEIDVRGSEPSIAHAAFRPDGRELALACSDKRIRFVDPETLAPTREPVALHRPQRLEYSADGERLLVLGDDGGGAIRVVDAAGGRRQPTEFHDGRIARATFGESGAEVVSAGLDGEVHVWRAEDGQPVVRMRVHEAPLCALAVSAGPGGGRVLSADEAGRALVWPVDVLPGALARRPRTLQPWEWNRELRLMGVRSEDGARAEPASR